MYLTFFASPGYNITTLESFGFASEADLFMGKTKKLENDSRHLYWGNDTDSIQGIFHNCCIFQSKYFDSVRPSIGLLYLRIYLDILNKARFNLLDVILKASMRSYVFNDEGKKQLLLERLSSEDFQIETRAQYPSDKVTLKRAFTTKNKFITWFDFGFKMNGKYDVDIFFEDSKRK